MYSNIGNSSCILKNLIRFFVSADETQIIRIGAKYLITEGTFYVGIGLLFFLYGYYRGINKPEMSLDARHFI